MVVIGCDVDLSWDTVGTAGSTTVVALVETGSGAWFPAALTESAAVIVTMEGSEIDESAADSEVHAEGSGIGA